MSRHSAQVRYQHMLDSALKAKALVKDKTRADLENAWIEKLALVRLFEILGEAANRVPAEEQKQHPEIPWSQIIGLRNRLIHGYDAIDLDILWQIVVQDLDPLIASLEAVLSTRP